MIKISNKLILLFATLLFAPILFLNPATSYADSYTASPLEVDFLDSSIVDGKSVNYDAHNGILTLTNADIDLKGKSFTFYENKGLNRILIALNGKNKIHSSFTYSNSVIRAFKSEIPIVVTGNGSLTSTDCMLFESNEDITIKSGTINAKNNSILMYSSKNIQISKDAKIKVDNTENSYSLVNGSIIANKRYAIYAEKMTNDPSSLLKVNGMLPYGAKFTNKFGSFKNLRREVASQFGTGYEVYTTLTKYNNKSKKLDFTNVKNTICGLPASLVVKQVSAGAFNNKYGKKLTTLKLYDLYKTPNNTFKGLKNLKNLKIASKDYGLKIIDKKSWNSSTLKYDKTVRLIGTKAFKGVGSSKPSALSVVVGSKKACKNIKKCGLSKKATVSYSI